MVVLLISPCLHDAYIPSRWREKVSQWTGPRHRLPQRSISLIQWHSSGFCFRSKWTSYVVVVLTSRTTLLCFSPGLGTGHGVFNFRMMNNKFSYSDKDDSYNTRYYTGAYFQCIYNYNNGSLFDLNEIVICNTNHFYTVNYSVIYNAY